MNTDARRDAIVAAAWEVFRLKGFDATSMSDVSQRLGGSKATLYNYWSSKEELFVAALEEALKVRTDDHYRRVSRKADLRERLLEFAHAYLKYRFSPARVDAHRLMIALAERSDLGAVLRLRSTDTNWRHFTDVLGREMATGQLREADPHLASVHFRGLIEADVWERRLNGERVVDSAEIASAAREGVAAFLRAYAP